MSRYVDADELIEHVWRDRLDTRERIADLVNRMASEPVRENVRGEWVKDAYGTIICSKCKGVRRDNRAVHISYCNSCGADMRER